jgi:hypothetical protein
MSRPYLNVEKFSYSNPTFSVDLDYLRLRGGGTVSFTGLSSSVVSFGVTNSYNVDSNNNVTGKTFSIHIGSLGGASAPGAVRLGTSSHYLYTVGLTFSISGTKIQSYTGLTFSY